MAWSPYKSSVIAYVQSHPGCSKADVARHVTYRRHFSKSYHIVNTAIRNGWIRVDGITGGRYRLSVG